MHSGPVSFVQAGADGAVVISGQGLPTVRVWTSQFSEWCNGIAVDP